MLLQTVDLLRNKDGVLLLLYLFNRLTILKASSKIIFLSVNNMLKLMLIREPVFENDL